MLEQLHKYGTQISPLLSIFFIGKAAESGFARKKRAWPGIQTALAATIGLTAISCAPAEPWTPRPYYDIYDEAVNLYYKSPRRPEAALALMDRACRFNGNGQDLLCFNLGVLRELRGDPPRLALAAYRRAQRIRPHAIYAAAVRRLAPDAPAAAPAGAYLQTVHRMISSCRNENRRAALIHLRRFVDTHTGNTAAQLSQADRQRFAQSLGQPFLSECLGAAAEYTRLLDRLRAVPDDTADAAGPGASDRAFGEVSTAAADLDDQLLKQRAALDEFASLWDIERRLRGLSADSDASEHPVTDAWDALREAAADGDGKAAAESLREFFAALRKSPAPQIAAGNSDNPTESTESAATTDDPGHARRVLALRRAAAILLRGDPYFARVQTHPEIEQALRRILGPR